MQKTSRWLLPILALVCLLPQVSSALGLLLGMALALTIGNPYLAQVRKLTPKLLGYAVTGLGAGMDLTVIGKVGLQGIGYTVIGISATLLLGTVLGRWLKPEGDTGLLVSVGTAICGGSAIAAVAPVIHAKSHEVTVALGTVFLLNATALMLFPWIGHQLLLTQPQFGLWSALAIHDTSSVVGATLQYGPEALAVGTTVKLARALWIVPVAFFIGFLRSRRKKGEAQDKVQAKKPWFILWFVMAAAIVTLIPSLQAFGHDVEAVAKRALVVTLFLIGSSLTRATLKSVGPRPLVLGVVLWLCVGSATLGAILAGWIHV